MVKYALNLESEAFNSLKMDFNNMLRKILATMTQKESENGEINIKLKITLYGTTAPDIQTSEYHADREVFCPKFEHTITSSIQIKEKATGFVGGFDYELVWDKHLGEFVMLPVQDAQQSMFDEPDESQENSETEDSNAAETSEGETEAEIAEQAGATDEYFQKAVEVVRKANKASITQLCINLGVGYSFASRLMDELEKRGVVGTYRGSQPREVLQYPALLI
jgi:ribosomal protein S25